MARWRLGQSIEHARKFGVHPFRDTILVTDVKDAETLDETGESIRCAVVLYPPERLGEIGLTSPNGNVQGTRRCSCINPFDEPARALRVVPLTDLFATALRIARLHARFDLLGRGPALGMMCQVRAH